MTEFPFERARRSAHRRRSRRGRRLVRWGLRLVATALVFGAGVALGQALHDNPKPGPARTLVRTLRPLPLAPSPRTVTVRRRRR